MKEFQKRMKTCGFIKNLKNLISFSDLFRIFSNNSATKALIFNTLHFTLKNFSQEQKSFFKCTEKHGGAVSFLILCMNIVLVIILTLYTFTALFYIYLQSIELHVCFSWFYCHCINHISIKFNLVYRVWCNFLDWF